MTISAPENGAFQFVDKPKTSLRIVSVAVWAASAFMFYKAAVEPPDQPMIRWGVWGFFLLCSLLVVREFLVRPVRVTTIYPMRREILLEESAPGRKRRTIVRIPREARFEIYRCEPDNEVAYGVRFRTNEKRWIIAAEYLSKQAAERITEAANTHLRNS